MASNATLAEQALTQLNATSDLVPPDEDGDRVAHLMMAWGDLAAMWLPDGKKHRFQFENSLVHVDKAHALSFEPAVQAGLSQVADLLRQARDITPELKETL